MFNCLCSWNFAMLKSTTNIINFILSLIIFLFISLLTLFYFACNYFNFYLKRNNTGNSLYKFLLIKVFKTKVLFSLLKKKCYVILEP